LYGMVNKGVQDMLVKKGGMALWEKVRSNARCPFSTFQMFESYDDKVTYDLVGAVSEELQITPAAALEAFGEYWIEYTATEGYGPLLSLFGASFMESIQNLNIIHERIGSMFPQLQPPRYEFSKITATTIDLHYFSQRKGLAPMMIGLLNGLAKKNQTKISLVHTPKSEENDHDIFHITII